MKRSPMPRRRKPMPSGTALSRGARLARKPMRAKPHRVTPAEREARAVVAARSGGWCELGIFCSGGAYAADWSHRIGRAQLGPWNAANGGDACRLCHEWAQTHPAEARERTGWILRSTDDFLTFPVHHAAHGWILLGSDGGFTTTEKRAAA